MQRITTTPAELHKAAKLADFSPNHWHNFGYLVVRYGRPRFMGGERGKVSPQTLMEVPIPHNGDLIESVTLKFANMTAFVRQVWAFRGHDQIVVSWDGDTPRLEAGGVTVNLDAKRVEIDPDNPPDYVMDDPAPEGWVCTVDAAELHAALHRASHAMARNDVQYYLNGVMLEPHRDRLRVATTDGHRLHVGNIPADGPVITRSDSFRGQWIADNGQIALLMRATKKLVGSIRLTFYPSVKGEGSYKGQAFEAMLPHGWIMRGMAIDGQYPSIDRVITTPPHSVTMHAPTVVKTLKATAGVGPAKLRDKGKIKVNFQDGRFSMMVEGRESTGTLPLVTPGDGELDLIMFNAGYLIESLAWVDGDGNATIRYEGKDDATNIAPTAGTGDTFDILMPVRM